MPKFMFVYRQGPEARERMAEASPEEMQKVMEAWMSWIQVGIESGWMVDGGDALKPDGRVVRADGSVTDGPFAESKELVGGYSMVETSDLSAAEQLTADCPIFAAGGSVEVRELANVGKAD